MAEPDAVVVPPPPPPMSASPPRILVIGAGSRGQTYARSVVTSSNGVVVAVAEPDRYRREQLGREFIWHGDAAPSPEHGTQFGHWRDFVAYEQARRARVARGEPGVPREGVDAAFVCVQDEMHYEVVVALAALGGIHIMCEKPLATRLDDCIAMYRAVLRSGRPQTQPQTPGAQPDVVFSIGHVMRYSPHNIELRRLLLEERVIGDVLAVAHTEPVGWWHFTHSYVRGNWRREDTSAPSLLTKSCHDIDLLLWLLCSPATLAAEGGGGRPDEGHRNQPHLPSSVSSVGSLQFFRRARKPAGAGPATNCLSCPAEPSCKYSAKHIYVDGGGLRNLESSNKSWPVNVVLPDIEDYKDNEEAKAALLAKLAEDYGPDTPAAEIRGRNWFGRCVFEGDNDVCDEQVVTMTWDDDSVPPHHPPEAATNGAAPADAACAPTQHGVRGRGAKTATFHMVAQTKRVCKRFTHIYGVDGEIYADSDTITVEDFASGRTTVHRPRLESVGHGGGDNGLTRQFVLAIDKVKNHGWTADRAQRELVGCTLDEVLRSHAMVFCAEDARKEKRVLDWPSWWGEQVEARLRAGVAT